MDKQRVLAKLDEIELIGEVKEFLRKN